MQIVPSYFLIITFRQHISYLDKDIWADLENDPEKAAASVIIDASRLEPFMKKLQPMSETAMSRILTVTFNRWMANTSTQWR